MSLPRVLLRILQEAVTKGRVRDESTYLAIMDKYIGENRRKVIMRYVESYENLMYVIQLTNILFFFSGISSSAAHGSYVHLM